MTGWETTGTMDHVQAHDLAAGEPKRHRAPATPVAPAARGVDLLRLQRLAGNAAVSGLLGKRPAQRKLDDDFRRGGTPTEAELAACKTFAGKVSDFVDEAHRQLMAGDIANWEGDKVTTFVKLLRQGKSTVLPWAGNAIEERVYALMRATDMGLPWVPQFAEGMGGASKPDIVVTVSTDPLKEALIDVTSARYHILAKAGGWTTSSRYVYVAEAWFDRVQARHLPTILAGVEAGGLDAAEVTRRIAEADAEHARKMALRAAERAAARKEYKLYGTVARLAERKFGGNGKAAVAWMRAHGLSAAKGVPKLRGKKKPSPETKAMMKRRAAKARELAKAAALAGDRSESHTGKPATSSSSALDDVMEQETLSKDEIQEDEDFLKV